jgi:hypothetical protein
MQFVIQCYASSENDFVYIDQIYINATKESRIDYDFDLRNMTELLPHSGSYSLGGSGDFDPDYAYFNRTGVGISGYSDVMVSVWYSYDSTESDDEFGLYYKDGMNWVPIFEALDPEIGNGNQLEWTHAEVHIPGYITTLVLQFLWSTSSTTEYVAIDDLEITGVPPGGMNYSGLMDEFRIYGRALSPEQIYQNYLCTKDGRSDKNVIVAEELVFGDIWKCLVTPNDSTQDDTICESNSIQIIMYGGGG